MGCRSSADRTPTAAYIGIVYCYLPFMVLPLYANLVKHDHRLLEAAYDLGAKPWQAFCASPCRCRRRHHRRLHAGDDPGGG
jgi:ABC-type spermidine/putrescine transport system permease subunit II